MFWGDFFLVSPIEFSALFRQVFGEDWHGDVLSYYANALTIKKHSYCLLSVTLEYEISKLK